MIIFIAGPSHTGKTLLAQRLMENLSIPYFSIDHLKMGLIKSQMTNLSPMASTEELTELLWPLVHHMASTAIQNKQQVIYEGCYIPADYTVPFTEGERKEIIYLSLAFSDSYLDKKLADILGFENVIEWRFPTLGHQAYLGEIEELREAFRQDNKKQRETCEKFGLNCLVIDKHYQPDEIFNWALKKVAELGGNVS